VDLTGEESKTRIVLSQACATPEARDMSEQGSGMLLDGLSAYVPTIS
jgi:hypothetical protein